MKKLLSTLLCTALVAASLTGCGSKPAAVEEKAPDTAKETTVKEETPATEETVVDEAVSITLGIWPEDTLVDDVAMHEGYVERMAELHPNVTCVPKYYKYSTDTFMPMVEAGNVPTIFETWFTEPQKLINANAVADITDILEARGWLDKMNPSIRELLSDSNGRVYGIPRDGYALGMMINVELFEEAGLVDADGYPLYPKTWDELAEVSKTIKEKTGSAGLCLLAKDNAGGWHYSNIGWAFGAEFVKDNGDGTYTAQLDSAEAIASMEFIKSLKWDYDVLTADPTSEDWGTGFTQLGTGGAAMYIGANDAVNQPTQANGLPVDKLALCPIPAGPGGQYSLMGGTPYMFSKDATEAEINAALDYLEVMGKAPVATADAIAGMEADAKTKVDAGCPVIPKFPCWTDADFLAADNKVVADYGNVDMKNYQAYFDATSSNGLKPEEPAPNGTVQDMYGELTKVLQEVVTNKNADVPALMKAANDNFQSIMDNAVAQ